MKRTLLDPRTTHLLTKVYTNLLKLPPNNYKTPPRVLAINGMYAFFEKGQRCHIGGKTVDRIMRIGINRQNGNFRNRIRQHYGRVRTLSGKRSSSIFRRHVGGAILKKTNPKDRRLNRWLKEDTPRFHNIEKAVSLHFRQHLSFVCFEMGNKKRRWQVEKGLIGLLSLYSPQTSTRWLGRHAADENIQKSGLWNIQDTFPERLKLGWVRHFEHAMKRHHSKERA